MCCWSTEKDCQKVKSIHNLDGEEANQETPDLKEHVDNIYVNRNVQTGILGFYYETKDNSFIVYSSIEAKTFCILMKLKPLHN